MLKERDKSGWFKKIVPVVFLAIYFMLSSPFLLAGKPLTIDRIFSDPRLEGITPREIKWALDNEKIAFLWNDSWEKPLSLWVYDRKSGKLEKIVSAQDFEVKKEMTKEEEERKTIMRKATSGITEFLWSPDSKKILIPYLSDLFLYELPTKKVKRLTKTDKAEMDPKFCGSSNRITFIRDNDLWLMDAENNHVLQLTKTGSEKILNGLSNYIALEELQRYSGYECSPDGTMIAYIQSDDSPIRELVIPDYLPRFVDVETQKRPVAGGKNAMERIGVLPSSGGETIWLDIPLAEFYVLDLTWHGQELLLRILERNNKILHFYRYSISNHSLKEIIKEEDGRWVNISNNFMIPTEKPEGFLWTSERNGFNHLYFFDREENKLEPITKGNWEITKLHGMNEKGIIYFSATAVEPEQRHLFSYDLSKRKMKRITDREGWHQITFSSDFRYFADLFSDEKSPPKLFLSQISSAGQQKEILDTLNSELNVHELAEIDFLTVTSRDQFEIHCQIFKPQDFKDKSKYPVIVHVHGGGYAQSARKQWKGIGHLFHHYLSQELKYLVVSVDYRGSSGYGRKCRTDVYLHLGGKDLDDVEDVVAYLKSLSYVDSENIGIWGWSYGGFLTNMALMKTPELFKAGAAVAPVNDWKNYDTQYTEERLSTPQEAPKAYERSSPITYAHNLKNHLLMIHGVKDDNVHFQDTVQLANKLIDNKIDFDLMIYPEGKHGIRKDSNRIHLFRKIAGHFERYLK